MFRPRRIARQGALPAFPLFLGVALAAGCSSSVEEAGAQRELRGVDSAVSPASASPADAADDDSGEIQTPAGPSESVGAPPGDAGADSSPAPGSDAGAAPDDVLPDEITVPVPIPAQPTPMPSAVIPEPATGGSGPVANTGGSGSIDEPSPDQGAGGASGPSLDDAFDIELVFDDEAAIEPIVLDAFEAARLRWESVVLSGLRDVSVSDKASCNGYDLPVAVDDLVIFVSVRSIDGAEGILGSAGPCAVRSASPRLPFAGAMEFDKDDLLRFAEAGRLEEIVLHEMGHVLGIGSLWEALGLVDDPSDGSGLTDTAFNGVFARDAFDSVGGMDYAGAKVPVENTGTEGEINGHWRESAMGNELMTTKMGSNPALLSVVTIASLRDLGYDVASGGADDYRWPAMDGPFSFQVKGASAPVGVIDLSDDVLRLPLLEVLDDGTLRVVSASKISE